MAMMRFCPHCETERSLYEIFCEGTIETGVCGWDLSNEPIRESGWRPLSIVTAEELTEQISSLPHCVNGHPMDEGDLMCMVCGGDLAKLDVIEQEVISAATQTLESASQAVETTIDNWRILNTLSTTDGTRERYLAERIEDKKRAVLTLYHAGAEPDVAIYDVLKQLPKEHVPEIITAGRWNAQAYVVAEELTGGSLSDFGIVMTDLVSIKHVMAELGQALQAFTEVGLRHCDLRPETLLVRTKDPLDLVITGFGSARLSEFDLEVISPLKTTRYMAPEVIAGGVSVASDWWSLGIILLEQLTQGQCFAGVNDQAFLIQILTNGVTIPDNLPTQLQQLLKGLLAKNHHERWQWPQVQAWLQDQMVAVPEALSSPQHELGSTIQLGERHYSDIKLFALAAADPLYWQEACDHLVRGLVTTWLEKAEFDEQILAKVREVLRQLDLSDDLKLMLVLKILNPDMPLVLKGDIITPSWLLQHPLQGCLFIEGFIPHVLQDLEIWLWRLQERANTVRRRADNLQIRLDEETLKIHLLSTSRAQLTALWEERLAIFPDANNVGILSLIERRAISEEDLIVLLSAQIGQFKSIDNVTQEVLKLSDQHSVVTVDEQELKELMRQPRLALYQMLNERIEGFACIGHEQLDAWTEQYRLEKRMPFHQLLLLLSVPAEQWIKPHKQQYISQIIDFFHKKVSASVLQGPLVRMHLGLYMPRIDIYLLGTERKPAEALLDHLVARNSRQISIDLMAFQQDQYLERRLSNLYRQSSLYKRDTGIDDLYMGFPFLIYQEPTAYRLPRIAPLLLWPIKLHYELGARNHIAFSFDHDREEIRINPALEGILGKSLYQTWKNTLDELLTRSALSTQEIIDALSILGNPLSRKVQALPFKQEIKRGKLYLSCSAVFFNVNFMGQSIGEELNKLKKISPIGTALETALRLKSYQTLADIPEKTPELERYFTVASDPSQENAVLQSRQYPGLLIEGPPGTGKSQTIVNMIADAIGRNKTILLVCQKKAALEVVYKRLVAEGLNNRAIMINDVNADRNIVISSIREQLDRLFKSPVDTHWEAKREQIANQITQLEHQLDSYHQALHHVDEQTGLTYRELIAELISLNKQPSTFVAPQLRTVLSALNKVQLAELEDECALLIRYWLPANYEHTALSELRAFSHEPATLSDFNHFFTDFMEAEHNRTVVLNINQARFDLNDPTPYQHWIETDGQMFLAISDSVRIQLNKWSSLFKVDAAKQQSSSEGYTLITELKLLEEQLAVISDASWCDLSPKLCLLEQQQLDKLTKQASRMMTPTSWYSFLSITRYSAKKNLTHFLMQQGEISDGTRFPMLFHALILEQQYRPIRNKLQCIFKQLQLPIPDNTIGIKMAGLINETIVALEEVMQLFNKIMIAPRTEEVEAALLNSKPAFEQLLADYTTAFNRYFARKEALEKLARIEHYLSPSLYQSCKTAIENNVSTEPKLLDIKQALPSLADYQYFRKRAEQLSATSLQLLAKLRSYQEPLKQIAVTDLEKVFRQLVNGEAYQAWKERIELAYPILLINDEETQKRIKLLAAADLEMRALNRVLLEQNIPIKELGSLRQWEDITRLTGVRARRLREFIEQGEKLGLMKLRSIWLMNPDVASRLLPLKAGLFDTVIYDEASQMPIQYAIPTLYRGKVLVVSGDEKQMPPSNFFANQIEIEEADLNLSYDELSDEEQEELQTGQWNCREIMDCPDLLQLARSVLPSTSLQIHYRSAYRELIAYSNAAFYNNQLNVPVRHPKSTIKQVQPIEFLQVNGVYHNQTNLTEAEQVVEKVAEIWQLPKEQRPSLGVVTFNKKQADLIEDLFNKKVRENEIFRTLYLEETQRVEAGENMSFFIKNVENVQGDERDIIIFSTTFGRNKEGVFRRNFGVLGQLGGERRLNVAITRARKKVILLCSMPIEDISDMLASQHQPISPRDYLQCYLAYARALSAGDFVTAQSLLKGIIATTETQATKLIESRQDALLNDVEMFIRSLGVSYTKNSGTGVFALDFAIEDPKTQLYIVGIECDAPTHPLLANARARDIWRTAVLNRSIPHIIRITSHEWYEQNEQIKAKLRQLINETLATGETHERS